MTRHGLQGSFPGPSALIRPRERSAGASRGALRTLAAGLVLASMVPAGCAADFSPGEAERIAAALALAPGMTVADVGAGDGEWAVFLAREVGPEGRVWATEVKEGLVDEIRDRVAGEALSNVSVVLGDEREMGLPDVCCDAVLLRMVYHHFTDPATMRAELRRALKPGGLLAVIDIEPQKHWRDLEGVPDRGGHGIPIAELTAELVADGFETIATFDDWNGDEDRYCAVFRLGGELRSASPEQ